MKIISVDEKIEIDYILKKELLIPIRVYKVPIKLRNNELNFLEETILKLKNLDKNIDEKQIIKLLGLKGREELVKIILNRIENQEIEDEEEKILFFYQELISGKGINIITKKIENFFYTTKERWEDIPNIKKINFEKNNKIIKGYSFKYSNQLKLQQNDLINVIIFNNASEFNSKHREKISTKKISNLNLDDNEIMLLNIKLFIPKNNRDTILISNGFNEGFSNLFKNIIETYYPEFILKLKEETSIDIENEIKEDIEIPFENEIDNYLDIKEIIKNIEIKYKDYINVNGADDKIKIKEDIIKKLYNLLEKTFFEITKNEKESKLIQKNLIIEMIKDEFILKENMNMFNISSRNNLQKFVAKAIFYKKIENLNNKTFLFLENILNYRNDLEHSNEVNLNDLDIRKYIKGSYKIVSKLLNIKIKRVEKSNEESDYDEKLELQFNANLNIEKEFLEISSEMNTFIKDKLQDIAFSVDELEFSNDSIRYAINNIYSLFEYIFRKYPEVDKNRVFDKYRNLPNLLKSVKIKKSLGRFYLNYLYSNKENKELTKFISKIIKLRGHGNEKIITISKEELKKLKEESFNYIKSLLKDIK